MKKSCPICFRYLEKGVCPNCGYTSKDNQKENNNKHKDLLKNFIYIFIMVIILVSVKGIVKLFVHDIFNKVYTEKELKIIEDASFIKGFIYVNTDGLKEFCSNYGYIPEKYIMVFNQNFKKTNDNANKILGSYLDKTSQIIEQNAKKSIQLDYEKAKKYNYTQIEYCKYYDEQINTIIHLQKQKLKDIKPDMFLD